MTISSGQPLLLLTRDDGLAARVTAAAAPDLSVKVASGVAEIEKLTQRAGAAVALIDVRGTLEHGAIPPFLVESGAGHVVIALGTPRSDALLRAAALKPYAVEDAGADPARLRALLLAARAYLDALEENRILREQCRRREEDVPPPGAAPSEGDDRVGLFSIRELSRILRNLNDLETMLDRLVGEVAESLHFARAGLLVREAPGEDYVLRAGWMLIEDSRPARIAPDDPFVRWFERRAHILDRAALERARAPEERIMLRRMLDGLGAEIMAPLRARTGLLGWLFVGHHLTGLPLDRRLLGDLSAVADMIAASLESALLYREITVRRKMAENLLQALPDGVVFADPNGRIRWFGAAAAAILERPAAETIGQPVEFLGGRLADLLRRALAGETVAPEDPWRDPATGRPLRISVNCLMESGELLGALAIVTDLSARLALKEKQEQLERAAFWNELSAGMSHEIRNPLVAIKTFAQLLPERYEDPEFRADFSQMVDREVDRLNGIIDQINSFAHPPEVCRVSIDIREPLLQSLQDLDPEGAAGGAVRIERLLDDELPAVAADEAVLRSCFRHLLANAVEAVAGRPEARIRVSAEAVAGGASGGDAVKIRISDNGPGMKPEIREKVFSPFCTTKAHGMGLGLPLAQRAIIDHNGQLDILSNGRGTTVTIMLPAGVKAPAVS